MPQTTRQDRRLLTEDQVRVVLESPLPTRHLADIMGVSAAFIRRIRHGLTYTDVATDLPRMEPKRCNQHTAYGKNPATCDTCIHHCGGQCSMGFPEAARSSTFAAYCSIFQRRQAAPAKVAA